MAENTRLKERLEQLEADREAAIEQQRLRQQQHHEDIFETSGDMAKAIDATTKPEVSDRKVEPDVESSGGGNDDDRTTNFESSNDAPEAAAESSNATTESALELSGDDERSNNFESSDDTTKAAVESGDTSSSSGGSSVEVELRVGYEVNVLWTDDKL